MQISLSTQQPIPAIIATFETLFQAGDASFLLAYCVASLAGVLYTHTLALAFVRYHALLFAIALNITNNIVTR